MGRGASADKLEHDFVKEQDESAGHAFRIWVNSVRHRVGSQLWHLEGPGLLAAMASDDREDVEKCIELVANDFKVYNIASEKAAKSPFIANLIKASSFKTALMQDVVYVIIAPDHHDFHGE